MGWIHQMVPSAPIGLAKMRADEENLFDMHIRKPCAFFHDDLYA